MLFRLGLTGAAATEEALSLMLRSADPPTAVFSAQNLVTEGALHALWRAEIQHAVAHVSFNDIPLADLLDPALTVVRLVILSKRMMGASFKKARAIESLCFCLPESPKLFFPIFVS